MSEQDTSLLGYLKHQLQTAKELQHIPEMAKHIKDLESYITASTPSAGAAVDPADIARAAAESGVFCTSPQAIEFARLLGLYAAPTPPAAQAGEEVKPVGEVVLEWRETDHQEYDRVGAIEWYGPCSPPEGTKLYTQPAAIRNAALEEAIKKCALIGVSMMNEHNIALGIASDLQDVANDCVEAIRALKSPDAGKE